MLKNITRLEHVIGDKVYHLTCDADSPIEHVKEALFNFTKFVGQIEDKIKESQQKPVEEPKSEEAPVEAPKE